MLGNKLSFTVTVTVLVPMLLSFGFAKAFLNGTPALRDGYTLFAPDVKGEIVAHPIVNLTTDIEIPGTTARVNITGTAEELIVYINTNYPDYVWPDVEDLNSTTPKASAENNTVYCNVGKQGSYYTATIVMKHLHHFGSHTINVGAGPATCTQVSCHTDDTKHTIAIWFCNDDDLSASPSYNEVADLAQVVLDQCVEFDTPLSWIRGQAFDTSLPWNVIVTAQDTC